MMIGIGLGVQRGGVGGLSLPTFLDQLKAIGGDTRWLWTPRPTDAATSTTDDAGARTITWDATVAARLSALGRGTQQSFVAASSQYGTSPDTADMSFGNGTVDQAFSGVVLHNTTDSATARRMLSKYNVTAGEWHIGISASDLLVFALFDQSAGVNPLRISDSAIPQGAWTLSGWSYDGTGGATAANGASLYVNGAPIASTPTNNASYVAMENGAAPIEVGTLLDHSTQYYNGGMALQMVCQKNMSAADHAAVMAACRSYFGVPL